MDQPPSPAKLAAGSPRHPAPFGKYQLLGLIARGGMAEVYRAKQKNGPDRLYAIKCMRPQLAKEARFVDMFIREGKLAVLLEHPSIVRTFEIGRIDGRYFIAMEYIGGKDLTQVLRRSQETNARIPVPHAIYIAARMCEGLHYAHTLSDLDGRVLNIVNRDVSPSNVRISYDGEIKLIDFGIAQALVAFTSEIGILKGKFSYMSPEQIRGMPLDARTDVFSTGIVLHEMLTTEKLFRGDTEFALMEKVRKADVPPPSKFNRRVPEALDRLCLRALARDLPDRFQSAKAMADELNQLLLGYRFTQAEMSDFQRSLFRTDYAKELEDLEACRARPQPAIEEDTVDDPKAAPELEAVEVQAEAPTPPSAGLEAPTGQLAAVKPEEAPPEGAEGKSGLWARITGRFRR